MSTTLITGGTVVTATGRVAADVLVDGETIVAVLAPGSHAARHRPRGSVDTVIDATGKYVIPGGIDAHTHMELPFGGTDAQRHLRDRHPRRGAGAARRRSSTSPCRRYGERVEDGLAAWHEKAAGNCAIDYGFHQIIGGVDEDSLEGDGRLVDEGITSFKLFMAYPGVFYSDDAQILQGDAEVGRDRADDDDARRERPRDRRARRSSSPSRARPTRTTTASPAPGRWRRRRRTARSCWPTSPARRSTSCT